MLLNNYKKYFIIVPLCEGLYYSLKCNIDGSITEVKPRKLKLYSEYPQMICYKCSNYYINIYNLIKNNCIKNKLNIMTSKQEYLKNNNIIIKCENNHIINTNYEKITYCKECFISKKEIIVHKKISRNNNTKFEIRTEKIIISIEKNTKSHLIEFINRIINCEELYNKTIILKKKNYNNIKLLNKLKINYEEFLDYIYIELSIDKFSKHINNNIKTPEICNISEKNVNENIDICIEISNTEIINIINKRNNFEKNYYEYLKKERIIINYEENNKNNSILNNSKCNKYNNFRNIINGNVDSIINYYRNDVTHKNINHYFIENYKIFNLNETNINNIIVKCKCKLDLNNYNDCNFNEIIETKIEEKYLDRLIIVLKYLRNIIEIISDHDYIDDKIMKEFLLIISKLENMRNENFTLYDIITSEILSVIDSVNIDPIIINTIIFSSLDSNKSPFYSYYYQNSDIVNDEINNLYIRIYINKYLLLTDRAAQKLLYIDSNVASLFWKIVIKNTDLISNNWYNKYNNLINICPNNMFDLDCKHKVYTKMNNIQIYDIFTNSFNLLEFINQINCIKEKGYKQRSYIVRLIILLSKKNIIYYQTNKKLVDYMLENYYKLLNDQEINIISKYNPDVVKALIKSEIKNIFNRMILDEKKTIFIGSIMYPKLQNDILLYDKNKIFPELLKIKLYT